MNSFSTGNITGISLYTGGLVGQTVNVDITNCFAAGDVTGKSGTAGIVGYAGGNSTISGNSNITNCYATGSITGTTYTGGIVGNVASYGKKDLTNCYALNKNITGSSTSFPNRLVGYISSFHMGNLTTTNCFAWDNMEGNYNSTQPNEKLYGSNLTSVEVWNTFPAEKWTGWSTTVWAANDYFKFRLPVPVWTDKNIQADATHLMPPIMLTYDGNGFTSEADTVPVDSKEYLKPSESGYPEKATVKEPVDMKKEGFEFEKWTTKPDGAGDSYQPGDEIEMKESLTLYAQWKQKSDGNKDGNSDGGTGGAVVVNPEKPEKITGFENETIIEKPEKVPEIIKPVLVILFIFLAFAIYLFVKKRRDDEEDETGI
ncbi:putative repeat protein (TIGR02543 family) [Methanimicrococcus blatticola]|uniref:Putative repeat protein (TIGR02543 family) n=1 Tax=Methanimicrococcus blatticola TaxID=91560 RepID=A0A484F7Q0_9EURY|nr:InlB B-repeat-containing protein [Methanimicrococcus blatticola]MBZ3936180.1 InlB B-repeat-containing protein [Methanimicrococcus blatticola]MCC2508423.1 InlB B-repeat-containing protein [Methanimicrococcus blatticola]TDQ70124.1 putative repeat protein (TIGR02543 family) [Methanimicrococcus blatticola]